MRRGRGVPATAAAALQHILVLPSPGADVSHRRPIWSQRRARHTSLFAPGCGPQHAHPALLVVGRESLRSARRWVKDKPVAAAQGVHEGGCGAPGATPITEADDSDTAAVDCEDSDDIDDDDDGDAVDAMPPSADCTSSFSSPDGTGTRAQLAAPRMSDGATLQCGSRAPPSGGHDASHYLHAEEVSTVERVMGSPETRAPGTTLTTSGGLSSSLLMQPLQATPLGRDVLEAERTRRATAPSEPQAYERVGEDDIRALTVEEGVADCTPAVRDDVEGEEEEENEQAFAGDGAPRTYMDLWNPGAGSCHTSERRVEWRARLEEGLGEAPHDAGMKRASSRNGRSTHEKYNVIEDLAAELGDVTRSLAALNAMGATAAVDADACRTDPVNGAPARAPPQPGSTLSSMPPGSVPLHEPYQALHVVCMASGVLAGALQRPLAVPKALSDVGGAAYQEWVLGSPRAAPRLTARTWNAELPDDAPDFHAVLCDLHARGRFFTDRHVSSLLQLMLVRWQQELPAYYRFLYLPVETVKEVINGFATVLAYECEGMASVGATSYISLFRLLRSVSPSRWLHLYARFREMVVGCMRRRGHAEGVDRWGAPYRCVYTYRRVIAPRSQNSVDITGQISRAYLHLFGAAGRTHLENLHRHPHVWARFLPTFPGILMRDFERFGFSPMPTHRRRAYVAYADLGLFNKCLSMLDWNPNVDLPPNMHAPSVRVVGHRLGAHRGGRAGYSRQGSPPPDTPCPNPRLWTVSVNGETMAILASATRGPNDYAVLLSLVDQTGIPLSAIGLRNIARAAKLSWDPPDPSLARTSEALAAAKEAEHGEVTFNKAHWRPHTDAGPAPESGARFEITALAKASLGVRRVELDGTSHRRYASVEEAGRFMSPAIPLDGEWDDEGGGGGSAAMP